MNYLITRTHKNLRKNTVLMKKLFTLQIAITRPLKIHSMLDGQYCILYTASFA